ncbi:radical SAM protein [Candidatus Berkiella cookevillensis]|uniref:Radical SAM protein n=1 Tax=Candidatus Berkiella cookevillensis TaxID=437022 RepID=A0A0Q9YA02_9GAMM|nr:radical SAM protein [Candidatus Berkiella cookevillensis]MCS5707961.1 radical SAM protein [Candidatus Berkiella cookevillensis]
MSKIEAVFVLKTVERCNINCTYCYFFNKNDQSYKEHPPLMSEGTLFQVADFILNGCKKFEIKNLVVCFHGGEPLMQKKDQFEKFCLYIVDNLVPGLKVSFILQTNGLLINDEWLNLLQKFNVNISISLDGPKLINDKYRIDHAGRGTFNRVRRKIDFLREHEFYKLKGFSILSVISEFFEANEIYNFFFNELCLNNVDFLIPDNTHDEKSNFSENQLGNFLSELFMLWINDRPQKISIRYFNGILNRFLGKPYYTYGHGSTKELECLPLVTISSDGSLSPSDEFRSTSMDFMNTNMNCSSSELDELLKHDNFEKIDKSLNTLPKDCASCLWKNICQGGGLVNRYSAAREFDNPSVFCNDLKIFYRTVSIELIKRRMSIDHMIENLNKEAA